VGRDIPGVVTDSETTDSAKHHQNQTRNDVERHRLQRLLTGGKHVHKEPQQHCDRDSKQCNQQWGSVLGDLWIEGQLNEQGH
jgi:hypothetical protein